MVLCDPHRCVWEMTPWDFMVLCDPHRCVWVMTPWDFMVLCDPHRCVWEMTPWDFMVLCDPHRCVWEMTPWDFMVLCDPHRCVWEMWVATPWDFMVLCLLQMESTFWHMGIMALSISGRKSLQVCVLFTVCPGRAGHMSPQDIHHYLWKNTVDFLALKKEIIISAVFYICCFSYDVRPQSFPPIIYREINNYNYIVTTGTWCQWRNIEHMF